MHTPTATHLEVFRYFNVRLKGFGIDEAASAAWAKVAAEDYKHALRRGWFRRAHNFTRGENLQFFAAQARLGMPAVRLRRYKHTPRDEA